MFTVLVVDDEPRAVDRLAMLLGSFPGVELIGTARDVGDAERFLAGRVPDVVFLDIDMPGRQGFDLVPSVPPTSRIVFVTAHEDRALDAFRAGAVDYILKPVDRDRLAITIDRLESRPTAAAGPANEAGPPAAPGEEPGEVRAVATGLVTLGLAGGRETTTVPLSDVAWVEAFRNRFQADERLVSRVLLSSGPRGPVADRPSGPLWWRFRGIGADRLPVCQSRGFGAFRSAPVGGCGCRSRAEKSVDA
ncbi:MAG: response regulator [Planctomycetia bacterium]|nr:response regulator [Planctomycetia bacterium]